MAADRDRLAAIRDALTELDAATDPKLAALVELLESSPAQKIAVFSTFGRSVRYLDEHLAERVGGRERVAVIGSESTPDQRLASSGPLRSATPWCAPTTSRPTARSTCSSPRTFSRRARTSSRHRRSSPTTCRGTRSASSSATAASSDCSQITTRSTSGRCSPRQGELERLLGLEARIQAKVKAASGVYGMEAEVIEGSRPSCATTPRASPTGTRSCSTNRRRTSGAFIGEELRRLIDRALAEGEVERVLRLPWGIGACFRQTAGGRSQGAPGVFFATRTPADARRPGWLPLLALRRARWWASLSRRTWRSCAGSTRKAASLPSWTASTLRTPGESRQQALLPHTTSAPISEPSKNRSGPSSVGRLRSCAIRPSHYQRAPTLADEALSVERSSAVRRAIGEIQDRVLAAQISRDEAAQEIVRVVDDFGLQPIESQALPEKITAEQLGVVCWMAVLPGASRSAADG